MRLRIHGLGTGHLACGHCRALGPRQQVRGIPLVGFWLALGATKDDKGSQKDGVIESSSWVAVAGSG